MVQFITLGATDHLSRAIIDSTFGERYAVAKFLPLCMRGTSHRPVSICLSVRL